MTLSDSNFQYEEEKKHVLIIEDDFYIQDLYKDFLELAGYSIQVCNNGEEGYKLAVATQPSVILLDIMLPKINGIEVIRLLKNNNDTKNIPIVLITNLGHQDIINAAITMGAQGYLLKVRCSPEQLVSTVAHFIDDPNYIMISSLSD